MYNSNNIADKIKTLAKSKGISVKKVLEGVGLGFNTMSNMKTSMPKADNLAKIADYLDCSVDYLLGRTDEIGFTGSIGYDQLDDIDKAEIRGMIRQMLKADKYQKTPTYTIPVAARGPLSEDAVLTDEEKAAADAKHPDLA